MARPKGIPMSEEQKELRRKKFKGENNPFYGKKHSAETRKKMSENHADFSGDLNPFKKSLTEEKKQLHKERCKKLWEARDENYRTKFGKNFRTGFEEITGAFWYRILTNARIRKIELEVTIEQCWQKFVEQDGKCALSGEKLKFSNKNIECTASLDRIDSSKGYVIDNIQWLHKDVNRAKWCFSQKYFIDICKKVVNNVKE